MRRNDARCLLGRERFQNVGGDSLRQQDVIETEDDVGGGAALLTDCERKCGTRVVLRQFDDRSPCQCLEALLRFRERAERSVVKDRERHAIQARPLLRMRAGRIALESQLRVGFGCARRGTAGALHATGGKG